MQISNTLDLFNYYNTTRAKLDVTLSARAKRVICVSYLPTAIRIGTFLPSCNTEFYINCNYPFETSAVDIFLDTIEHTCSSAYDEAFDDPIDMLMNMTNPGEDWTVEDAKHIMSDASGQGWHLDPKWTPEDILAIYNDLEPEEEGD